MDDKKIETQIIQQIRSWCIDNSFIDYDEEFSDNGDCLILLSELEKFLDSLEKQTYAESKNLVFPLEDRKKGG